MRRGFAALLGAVLLVTTGCTLTDRAGAAVVVDGSRYTTEQLATDFRALDRALGQQQKPGTMDQVNRAIISIFISKALMEKAIAAEDLTVDKAAVSTLRKSLEDQLGGADKLEAFAATRGVPPSMIWTVLKNSVFQTELGAKLIGGTDTDAQSKAALQYLQQLSKTMTIDVAPRYGKWDPSQLAANTPADDLSVAAATAAPQQ